MTTSIWEKQTFFAPADVLIIGAGFAGLWTAYHLLKENKKTRIMVIDKGVIPTGASTRNAGFACFGSLTELLADEQSMGTDKMLQLVEMRYKGLQMIENIFGHRNIDYECHGGYELFTEKENYVRKDLEMQAGYLNKILKPVLNTKNTFSLAANKQDSFGFNGVKQVMKNKLEGQLHPVKMVQALFKILNKKNVQILTGIEATGIEKINDKVHVRTKQQIDLMAGKLIVCNNGITGNLVPGLTTTPSRGQVLVTSPIKNLSWKGTFHYDEGYYYFRNLGNRVLLGGARNIAFEEESTSSLNTTLLVQNELERFLHETILPGKTFTIENRWSGTMGMGESKMPDVKQVEDNIFCALNLGGIGVASAPIIGKKIAAIVNE